MIPETRISRAASRRVTFDLTSPLDTRTRVHLSIRARVDWATFGGHNPDLMVRVNQQPVGPDELVNKPLDFLMFGGADASWFVRGFWRLVYSPSFSARFETSEPDSMMVTADPYEFAWDITAHTRVGRNDIDFDNVALLPTAVVVLDGSVVAAAPAAATGNLDAAVAKPVGRLPTYAEKAPRMADLHVELTDGGLLKMQVGNTVLRVATRTSEPHGQWCGTSGGRTMRLTPGTTGHAAWKASTHRVERTVTVAADHVHVADQIRNTSGGLLGLIVEHRLARAGDPPQQRLLGGRTAFKRTQDRFTPGNPTAAAEWHDMVAALAADSDEFRLFGRMGAA